MTKDDLKLAFGSLSRAAKIATEHGKPISAQAINQWPEQIDILWAAFFYLIQQKHQLSLADVWEVKDDNTSE